MNILFLSHRIPYPPDKGDKIRSHFQLRYLGERHCVRLATCMDDPRDRAHLSALASWVDRSEILPLGRRGGFFRAGVGLMTGQPLSVAWFPKKRLEGAVRRLVHGWRPDLVFAFSSQMAPTALTLGVPVVLDMVDRDSAKWAQYGARARGWRRLVYRREARRLARAEEAWIEQAAVTVVISEQERALFAPRLQPRIRVMGNPVRLEAFSSDHRDDDGKIVLFTGALDYLPNVDAVTFFARDVMPRIREQVTDAEFWVVGPRASRRLRQWHGRNGTRFTGYVEDLAPIHARTAVSVAPFRFTQGVLNKVLEALAAGLPVVATSRAVGGIGLTHGEGVYLGEDAPSLASHVVSLLRDPAARRRLGQAGRDRVAARCAWPGDLVKLDAILETAVKHGTCTTTPAVP